MAGMNAADVVVPGRLHAAAARPPARQDVVPLPEPGRSLSSMLAVVDVAIVRGLLLGRPQNVAIGLIGDPVPRVGSGAAVSRNSYRFSDAASSPTASRSRLSNSGIPR